MPILSEWCRKESGFCDEALSKAIQSSNSWTRTKRGEVPKSIKIGDIQVTPFFVSHSTYDASMLLMEADGKKILHTGDYRGHGYLSKGLFPTLKKYVGQVDYLITEGTMLGQNVVCETEHEISNRMYHAMMAFKYVFVLASSTDIERLAAIQSVAQSAKHVFASCSLMHYSTLDYFRGNAGHELFDFKFYKYSPNRESKKLIAKMRREGFAMVIGPSHQERVKQIMSHFDTDLNIALPKLYAIDAGIPIKYILRYNDANGSISSGDFINISICLENKTPTNVSIIPLIILNIIDV